MTSKTTAITNNRQRFSKDLGSWKKRKRKEIKCKGESLRI